MFLRESLCEKPCLFTALPICRLFAHVFHVLTGSASHVVAINGTDRIFECFSLLPAHTNDIQSAIDGFHVDHNMGIPSCSGERLTLPPTNDILTKRFSEEDFRKSPTLEDLALTGHRRY